MVCVVAWFSLLACVFAFDYFTLIVFLMFCLFCYTWDCDWFGAVCFGLRCGFALEWRVCALLACLLL